MKLYADCVDAEIICEDGGIPTFWQIYGTDIIYAFLLIIVILIIYLLIRRYKK